ncbi:DUF4384 domain-containing protein, partial [Breznakiellaceae bacterium SP9]
MKRMTMCILSLSALVLMASCASEAPVTMEPQDNTAAPVRQAVHPEASGSTGDGISLDAALSAIAAYYGKSLGANTKIALLNVESDSKALSDYIFEKLWIKFQDSTSFVLIERQNLPLIQRELTYQAEGMVSDESAKSIGQQYGPQTLVYGKITRLGDEYRLVLRAADVETAAARMQDAAIKPDRIMLALLGASSSSRADAGLLDVLYSDAGNPFRLTVQADKSSYHEGEYMTLRIYSERNAYFKITHIDVNDNTQVLYPRSPGDNNFIRAGETRQIPDTTTRFRMTKPYGDETILAGVYERPFRVRPDKAAPLSNNSITR